MSVKHYVCTSCGVEKDVEQFYKGFSQRRPICKTCILSANKQRIQSCPIAYLRTNWNRLKHLRKRQGYCVDLVVEDLRDIFQKQGGLCALSGVVMTFHPEADQSRGTNASIDRIDVTRGYSKDNVRLVCSRVNLMRGNQCDGDFYWWAKTVVNKFDQ